MMTNNQACQDHLGNKFESIKAMVDFYGVPYITYHVRRTKLRWPLEECLTTPSRKNRYRIKDRKYIPYRQGACKDHLGNSYASIDDMAKYYGIPTKVLENRLSYGWSLEDSLTQPINKRKGRVFKDHVGNEYPSFKAMCDAYNISTTTVRDRLIRRHWAIGRALTTSTR